MLFVHPAADIPDGRCGLPRDEVQYAPTVKSQQGLVDILFCTLAYSSKGLFLHRYILRKESCVSPQKGKQNFVIQ